MKKEFYIFLLLIFISILAKAQQVPIYSQYMFDKYIINPACAGSSNSIYATLDVRNQFSGIEGAPLTEIFTFSAPLQAKHMGLGLKVINDVAGILDNTNVYGTYAYQIGLGNGRLAFGLDAGLLNESLNYSDVIKTATNPSDPVFGNGNQSKFVPDANFGVYYYSEKIFAGYSALHLIPSNISTNKNSGDIFAALQRHHFLNLGYSWEFKPEVRLEPIVLIKYVEAAPVQFDLTARLVYKNFITTGLMYRSGDALALFLQLTIKESFRIGYSYDYTISNLSSYVKGGNEIMVQYKYTLLPPARKKDVHPRYYIQ